MSKISNAILETLLEEITDYQLVDLNETQIDELETICDRWNDDESIETEINGYLIKNGYKYWSDGYRWVLPTNADALKYELDYVISEGQEVIL
jgi:hypothetical protein